ncbi:hypothetical protein M9Y10_011185 [Tritrichomonas musculus]|uniref:Initiator binding domain-containing protein n=1 Tax=Tritrichomonas musculus TaxID=1915356 RepID=A0ABR2IJV7_9EUKA
MSTSCLEPAYISNCFYDTPNLSYGRSIEGKIKFPSLIPISENLHDWIEQFRNEGDSSPPDSGKNSNDCITNCNNSYPENNMQAKVSFVPQTSIYYQSEYPRSDFVVTRFRENGLKEMNMYTNQNAILKPVIPSSCYNFPRPIKMVTTSPWSFSKHDEKKLLDFFINPIELNFLPKELWLTQKVTLRSVFQTFFKARSTKNLRFEHKLWNALALSKRYPELIPFLGVFWVSKNLLKVNRDIFGALINVSKPAAALFNNQGSFLTHGFLEVTKEKALRKGISPELVEDVDESVVRLFKHSAGLFTADSNKADVSMCRWNK